jgi:hypothetical protein
VEFNLQDRLLLIPVEVVSILLPMLLAMIIFYFLGGLLTSVATAVAFLAGVVLFPILLPFIPTSNFSTKGFILGGIVALPFVLFQLLGYGGLAMWQRIGLASAGLLIMTSVTAFLTLNFTGATTFTSRSGVKQEIFTYIPVMAGMFGIGVLLSLICNFI